MVILDYILCYEKMYRMWGKRDYYLILKISIVYVNYMILKIFILIFFY